MTNALPKKGGANVRGLGVLGVQKTNCIYLSGFNTFFSELLVQSSDNRLYLGG